LPDLAGAMNFCCGRFARGYFHLPIDIFSVLRTKLFARVRAKLENDKGMGNKAFIDKVKCYFFASRDRKGTGCIAVVG
jgi:hypothetical protein